MIFCTLDMVYILLNEILSNTIPLPLTISTLAYSGGLLGEQISTIVSNIEAQEKSQHFSSDYLHSKNAFLGMALKASPHQKIL